MVMVYMGGPISGAHYNPAVTIAIWIRKKIEAREVIPYILSQIMGALCAALLVVGAVKAQTPLTGLAAELGSGELKRLDAVKSADVSIRPEVLHGLTAPPLRSSAVLEGLQADSSATRRGAKEVQLYRRIAPSVVLIVSDDDSFGSGTLINSNGDILTNWHVVEGKSEVWVIFKPARDRDVAKADLRPARVIRVDEIADRLPGLDQTPALRLPPSVDLARFSPRITFGTPQWTSCPSRRTRLPTSTRSALVQACTPISEPVFGTAGPSAFPSSPCPDPRPSTTRRFSMRTKVIPVPMPCR